MTPTTTIAASEIAKTVEVIPTTEDKEGEKKGKKKVIVKMFHKAHPGESNDDNNALGEDPFSNLDLIQDLADKFAMFKVLG
ncbi:hypothetical protein COCNU_13G007960 [Cocos nucifera]|uniref:Uncharacterized protein n=1 Tax=Cocos nucifera TaxID=13894 RepID=A0A8K0NB58_COCNU|nr:hypothetical protein COCNU_13G007960 [Cocos nucifera]